MMLAIASTAVVPSIEQWVVLVTSLGTTVILILGALYVLIFTFTFHVQPLRTYLTSPA